MSDPAPGAQPDPAPVAVILNRQSGALVTDGAEATARMVADRLRGQGLDAQVTLAGGSGIETAVARALGAGAGTIVVGGGDGSIRTAIRRLAGTGATLGILPLGTMDLLARNLGIPEDLGDALDVVAGGHARRVDLGFVNHEPFAVMAMVGRLTAAALTRERERHTPEALRWARTAVTALSLWRRHGAGAMRLGNGRTTRRLRTALVMVSTRRLSGGLADPLAARGGARDLLQAYAIPRASRALIGPDSLFQLLGTGPKAGALEPWRLMEGRRLSLITPRGYTLVTLDGEPQAMKSPLVFSQRRRCLAVLAPPAPRPGRA